METSNITDGAIVCVNYKIKIVETLSVFKSSKF